MNKKRLLLPLFLFFLIIGILFFYIYITKKTSIVSNKNENKKQQNFHHQSSLTINSEKDFLVQMIYHHQEAIDAAQKVLEKGGTIKEVREIASNIIKTQKNEVEIMKTLYQQWFKENLPPQSVYHSMMRPLENLIGKDLDKQFLEDMIVHHQGAIMMAEKIRISTNKPEIHNMIDSIIKVQTDEIKMIEKILKENFK